MKSPTMIKSEQVRMKSSVYDFKWNQILLSSSLLGLPSAVIQLFHRMPTSRPFESLFIVTKRPQVQRLTGVLAESKGFEPLTPLPVYRISSAGRYNHFDNFPLNENDVHNVLTPNPPYRSKKSTKPIRLRTLYTKTINFATSLTIYFRFFIKIYSLTPF